MITPSIARDGGANKARARGLLLALALVALGGSCAEQPADEALAPIGGERSRPLPHSDIFGFLRVEPGGRSWTLLQTALSSADPLALQGSFFAPVQLLSRALIDESLIGDGALIVFFLDPDVHGSAFAFHVEAPAEEVVARLIAAGGRQNDSGSIRVARQPASSANPFGTAIRAAGVGGIVPELEGLPDHGPWAELLGVNYLVREVEGGALVLPREDGLRNLRDTLALARSGEQEAQAFLSLDVDRMLYGARDLFLAALHAPMVAMSAGGYGRGRRSYRMANRWFSGFLDLSYDLLQGIEHVFVEEGRPGEWILYLRTDEGGPTRDLLAAFEEEDPRVLLADAPLGLAAAGFAYDTTRLLEFWRRWAEPCFDRRRARMDVPEEAASYWGRRAWLGFPGGLEEGVQIGIAGIEPPLSPEELAERVSDWVSSSLDEGVLSLFVRGRGFTRMMQPVAEGVIASMGVSGSDESQRLRGGFLGDRWFVVPGESDDDKLKVEMRRLGSSRASLWSKLGLLPSSCSGIVQVGGGGFGVRAVLEVDAHGCTVALSAAVGR